MTSSLEEALAMGDPPGRAVEKGPHHRAENGSYATEKPEYSTADMDGHCVTPCQVLE
jgi:hypothetical protein